MPGTNPGKESAAQPAVKLGQPQAPLLWTGSRRWRRCWLLPRRSPAAGEPHTPGARASAGCAPPARPCTPIPTPGPGGTKAPCTPRGHPRYFAPSVSPGDAVFAGGSRVGWRAVTPSESGDPEGRQLPCSAHRQVDFLPLPG